MRGMVLLMLYLAVDQSPGEREPPQIRYSSGGLEDAQTRTDVCRILEGGERAFREREQRYAFPQDLRLAKS